MDETWLFGPSDAPSVLYVKRRVPFGFRAQKCKPGAKPKPRPRSKGKRKGKG